MKRVVLVTTASDLAADLVILCLKRRGTPFARFNQEDFPRRISISWPGYRGHGELVIAGEVLRVEDVRSGWFRHPTEPIAPEPRCTWVVDFVSRETAGFLEGFWEATPWFWMNRPSCVGRAANKLVQLARAQELGFRVPATMITNRPEAARAFVRGRPAVAKTISGAGLVDGCTRYAVYTKAVTLEDIASAEAIRASPVIFQERVPNAFDLRVTVVGKRVFAIKISTRDGDGETDWRAVDPSRLQYERYRLPAELEARSIALTDAFSLAFGALDFVQVVHKASPLFLWGTGFRAVLPLRVFRNP